MHESDKISDKRIFFVGLYEIIYMLWEDCLRIHSFRFVILHGQSVFGDSLILASALQSSYFYRFLRKYLVVGQFSELLHFFGFQWSLSVGKPRLTPVSFVK